MHPSFSRFVMPALGLASLLLPAVAHADPQTPAPPVASKTVAASKAKTPAHETPAARRQRRVEKKEENAKAAAGAPAPTTTQTREMTIEGRAQGPSIVFHIEKSPVHFELHDLGAPYSHDAAPPVAADAATPAKPAAPAPAAPAAEKTGKK
jgi:hypothetical protein